MDEGESSQHKSLIVMRIVKKFLLKNIAALSDEPLILGTVIITANI